MRQQCGGSSTNGANVAAKGKGGMTALHEAVQGGHVALARLLLEKGVEIDATDMFGRSAISRAALLGHVQLVRLLIENGANLNVKGGYLLHNSISMLGPAEEEIRLKILELPVKNGADVSVKDARGNTLLHRAAFLDYPSVVPLLLEYGAVLGAQNKDGETALDMATRLGHKAVSGLLLGSVETVDAVEKQGLRTDI